MGKNTLIIAEHKDGIIKKSVLGILFKAKEFSENISVVLLGKKLAENKELLEKFGVNKVYLYANEDLENYNPEIYSKLILDLIIEARPDHIFAMASSSGKDLMPRIAAKLETGLASDCIDARLENERLIFKRPIYAGKVFVDVAIKSAPALATFRPNVLEVKEQEQKTEVEVINKSVNIDLTNLSHKIIEIKKGTTDKPDLTEATIIISGGRGAKNIDGFKLLEKLAEAFGLNAVVGASRAVVDAGIVPHSMQVGQTGKTVTPTLYIACGISGAIQHLAGMSRSKIIVAINKDPEAPIFKIATYGIVGDLFKVVPILTEEIAKILSE